MQVKRIAAATRAQAIKASVLERLRAATSASHQALDQKLDAVRRLAAQSLRAATIQRYAAFYVPSEDALAPYLAEVRDLDFAGRSRRTHFDDFPYDALPGFPEPDDLAEAFGMLYVLEGSTLGGRFIRRALAERAADGPDVAFLDPYGTETGARWRSFLHVLEREIDGDPGSVEKACQGAVRTFQHADLVLCS